MRNVAIVSVVLLAACVDASAPVQQPTYCDCVPATTDAMSIAETGFPNAAIVAQDGYSAPQADGTTHKFVQFKTALATQAQIAASPAALCKSQDLRVLSSEVVPPGPEDSREPGSMMVKAICK